MTSAKENLFVAQVFMNLLLPVYVHVPNIKVCISSIVFVKEKEVINITKSESRLLSFL